MTSACTRPSTDSHSILNQEREKVRVVLASVLAHQYFARGCLELHRIITAAYEAAATLWLRLKYQ